MALRPLWIATQGLTIGLTPIYRAIQGLWPDGGEQEEDDEPLIIFGGGGGGREPRSVPDRTLERYRAGQERIARHNEEMMALILAAVAEEYCS